MSRPGGLVVTHPHGNQKVMGSNPARTSELHLCFISSSPGLTVPDPVSSTDDETGPKLIFIHLTLEQSSLKKSYDLY